MITANAVDTARLNLLLNELRLPLIHHSSASNPTKKAGRRPASSPPLPSTRSLNAAAVASSVISSRRGCQPERPSTTSTSRPWP